MAQYLGISECPYYKGKISEVDHRCCGGRITKYAVIKCTKKGKVVANDDCKKKCTYYPNNTSVPKMISPNQNDVSKVILEGLQTAESIELKRNSETEDEKVKLPVSKENTKADFQHNHNEQKLIYKKIVKPQQNSRKSVWKKWAEELSKKMKEESEGPIPE